MPKGAAGPNADVAREALRMWSAGDLEGTLATMSPDVEWTAAFPLPDLPRGKTVFRGHDEVCLLWRAFRSVWDEITLEIDEVLHDEESLLVLSAWFHAHGSGSGIDLNQRIFYVMDMDSEQRLLRLRPYESAAEAKDAAGLAV